jgi:photosynthetic reaction center H subunit
MDYDLAQIALYLFWIFFAGLIVYLQRESQREGYPIELEGKPGKFRADSLLFYPPPKTFKLPHGGTKSVPDGVADTRVIAGTPTSRLRGAPIAPHSANPMLDSIGPGSWAERSDKPDLTLEGHPRIVPIRVAPSYVTSSNDPKVIGFDVVGCDYKSGGKVVDLWVDRSECILRYIEVEVPLQNGSRRVLLPMIFAHIQSSPARVLVDAICGHHFADVPGTAKPDSVTLLEEDKICAYYGAGTLYALPGRQEPFV